MIIENLEFNGSSDILQYIPQVSDTEEKPQAFGPPPDIDAPQPVFQPRAVETPELFKAEIKTPQLQMDFSTPIADVVPSADFASEQPAGPYKNPQNNRVAALSLDNATAGVKSSPKNPFGLTDEQLHAAIAGIAAVAAFSKPVQTKLGDVIPKFATDHGDLSVTGMLASALVAAVFFFVIMKVLVQKK